jgi:DNA (cytosine-5)-methyltransferase 1
LRGQRIGDRERPLSAKTMERIRAGLRRYARPITFEARGNTYVRTGPDGRPVYARAWPVDWPTATLTTTEIRALAVPAEGRDGKTAAPVEMPLRTQSTRAETALVVPYYGTGVAHQTDGPLHAVPTRDRFGLAFIAELRGGGSDAREVHQPLATVTASGNHHMLVRYNSSKGEGGEMCTPTGEPARTVTTTGHQSLVGWPHEVPVVEDCTFRMLEPREIQAAMAFRATTASTGPAASRSVSSATPSPRPPRNG